MKRILRTPAAEQDLVDIWCSIALDAPNAADRVFDGLVDRIQQLAEFPELGAARSEVDPAARCLIEGNYLILYRLRDDAVEIVRIIHGARDLTDLF